jgi:hypothetical protein
MARTWTRDEIDELLRRNDKAVERAMVALYSRQTRDEQQTSHTRHDNGIGFSAAHASKGSYYARWVESGRKLTRHHLNRARKIALLHSKQLVQEANR